MQTTAAGSTEREMGNIEESVSYKLNALKETWTGLLTDVSRTSLGNIVDMITAISEAITGLVENLGLVKTALGAASGLFLTKTGFGTNIDLNNLSNSSLFGLGKWWNLKAGASTSVVKNNSKKKDSTNNSVSATTVAVNKDLADSMENIADSATNASSAMSDAKRSTDAFKNEAKETTSETKQLVVATEDLNEKTKSGKTIKDDTESSLTNGQKLISSFKDVAKSASSVVASFAVNWGASMLAETVISAATTAINNYINRVKYAIEAGQEAQTQISSLAKELDNTVDSADKYGKTYISLMDKASTTQKDGKTYYSQGSMTSEEWNSFIDANVQLAELMPQNVAYFDEQGNAMVNLGTSIGEVNSTLSEFISLQSQIAGFEIGDNLATAVKGILSANTEIEKENEKLSRQIEAAQSYSDWKSGISGLEQGGSGEKYGVYNMADAYYAAEEGYDNGYAHFTSSDVKTINELIDAAKQSGITDYATGINELADGSVEFTLTLNNASQDALDAFNRNVGNSSSFNREAIENQSQLSQNDLEVKANLQSLIPNFQAYGKSLANAINFSFSSDIKDILVSGVSTSIGNFDISNQTTDQLREIWGNNGENTSDWIYSNYVEPLTKLAAYDSDVQNEIGNYIDSILNSDSDSLKNQTIDGYEDMLSGVSSKLTDIMGGGDEAKSLVDSLIKLSGISDIEDTFEQSKDKIVDTYGQDLFDKLETKGQMDIAINLIDDNVEGDTQEIFDKIQAQWNKSANESSDHSISSLFSNQSDAGETFSDTVSSFQSDANTIDEALATLRTSGDVDFTSLLNDFPKLADSTDDLGKALSDIKTEKFTDFVENFADSLSNIDLTDKTALTNALNAFKMVLEDMNLSDIDMSKVSKQISSSLTKSLTEDDAMTEDAASAIVDSFTATLEESSVAKTFSKAISDNSSVISTYQTKMNALISAQNDFKDSGKLSVDTITSLIDAGINAEDITSGMSDGFSTLSKSLTDDFVQKYENIAKQLDEADASVFTAYCEQIVSSIKSTISAFDDWQNALSSSNQGANYDTIQGQLESMKSLFDEGWTGTDDWQTFAAMIDQYGVASLETFSDSYEKVSRWFQEGISGLSNFLTDLESVGMASNTDGEWNVRVGTYQQLADSLGTSVDVVREAVGKLEEQGFHMYNLADSASEITENYNALSTEIANTQLELATLEATGADQTRIDETRQKLADLQQDYADMGAIEQQVQVENAEKAQLLQKYRDEIAFGQHNDVYTTEDARERIQASLDSQIQQYASDGGFATVEEALKFDVTSVEISGMQEQIQSALQGENGAQLQSYIDTLSQYGAEELKQIDLTNGAFDTINGIDMSGAESALDGVLDILGLNTDQAELLIDALQDTGSAAEEAATLVGKDFATTGTTDSTVTDEQKVIHVKTQMDNGELEQTALQISQMSDQEITETFNITGAEQIEEIRNYAQELSGEQIDMTVQISSAQMDHLTGAITGAQSVEVDTSQAQANVDSLKSSVDSLTSSPHTVSVTAETGGSTARVNALSSAIKKVQGKTVSVLANVSGLSSVQSLGSAISALRSRTITITTNRVTNTSSGKTVPVTGTLFSGSSAPFVAHATGTAYNMLNLRAHAQGTDVALKHNENALINELGTEAIIREGKLYEVPGGTHIESLKKGDVVINAAQWAEIKKYGSTDTFAGTAYASGSLGSSTMSAYANHGKLGGSSSNSSSSSTSNAVSNAASAVTSAAKTSSSSSKKNSTTLDKIKEWIDKLFDWVEVKIEYLTDKADNYYTKAENAIALGLNYSSNYSTARSNIKKAIATNEQLLVTNQKGEGVYSKQATKVYNKYNSASKLSSSEKKQISTAYKRLMNGETIDLEIAEYSENVRTAISNIKEWTDKMYDCRYAVDEVTSTLIDQKDALYQLPIDEAEAKVEKLEQALTSLNLAYTKISSGKNISLANQSKNLDDQLSNQLAQLKTYQEAVSKLEADLANEKSSLLSKQGSISSAQNAVNSANSKVSSTGNAILSNKKLSSVLTSAQKKAVKNGESITLTSKQKKKLNSSQKNKVTAYNNALKSASTAATNLSNLVNEVSNAESDLEIIQNKYDEALQTAQDAEQEYLEQQVENEKEKFENIQTYYKNRIELAEKLVDLQHDSGSYDAASEYTYRISEINEELQKLKEQLSDSIASGIIQVGSEEWFEMQSEIVETNSELKDLETNQRKVRLEEMFERAAKSAQRLIDRLQTVNDIITDDMKFDLDGKLTSTGALSMMLDAQSLEQSKQKLENYVNERNRILTEEWVSKGYLGDYVAGVDTELDSLLEDVDSNIQNEFKNIESYQQSLLDVVIDANEKERDAILEVIDAQKEALSTKKDYYDYDKKLKSQNKDIASLRQQIAALQGSTSKDDIAKLKQLQAQLAEAEDEKQDTVQDHLYEMQTDALNQISDDITKYYEEMIATMKLTSENTSNAITEYLSKNNINGDNIASQIAEVLRGYLKTDTDNDGVDNKSDRTDNIISNGGLTDKSGISTLSAESQAKVDAFKAAVNNIGTDYADSGVEGRINTANSAYNALSNVEKSYVSNEYSTLTTAKEARNAELNRIANTVTSVSISSSSLSLAVGSSQTLSCNISPSSAASSNPMSWSSTNTGVATVSNGTVYAVASGSATIRVDCGGHSATCSVSVYAPAVAQPTTNTTTATTATTTNGQGNGKIEKGDQITATYKATVKKKAQSSTKGNTIGNLTKGKTYYVGDYNSKYEYGILLYKDKALKNKVGWVHKQAIKGYATGSRMIDEDQLAWTQENGTELIYRRSDGAMLTPLGKGDTVFSADKVHKLYDLLESDPVNIMSHGNQFSMPNIENVTNSNNINPVIECPITIMGNANEQEVKNAIKQMIPEINSSVQNSIRKDLRKAGRK